MGQGEELANWIYWEEYKYYCFPCLEKRLEEINTNREFPCDIDYDNGEACGYMQDYAYSDQDNPEQEYCCKCHKSLFTIGVD